MKYKFVPLVVRYSAGHYAVQSKARGANEIARTTGCTPSGGKDADEEAYARLFAAAPDLLDTLERAFPARAECAGDCYMKVTMDGDAVESTVPRLLYHQARELIKLLRDGEV